MYKDILFIRDISNHQCTHIKQPEIYTVTIFNLVHELNWPGKHHTTTAECRMWGKAIRNLCDEIK